MLHRCVKNKVSLINLRYDNSKFKLIFTLSNNKGFTLITFLVLSKFNFKLVLLFMKHPVSTTKLFTTLYPDKQDTARITRYDKRARYDTITFRMAKAGFPFTARTKL